MLAGLLLRASVFLVHARSLGSFVACPCASHSRDFHVFVMGVGGEALGGLDISCAFGQRQFRCIRVVVVSRYAGCYPLQDFTSMSPAEKNDWEYA